MRVPPSIVRLRFERPGFRLPLWLPVFLLWPIVLLVAIPVVLVVVIAALILEPRYVGRNLRFLATMYETTCAMRGTLIDIEGKTPEIRNRTRILISIH